MYVYVERGGGGDIDRDRETERSSEPQLSLQCAPLEPLFGLDKIFVFYFEIFVHESIIRFLPPTCIARAIAIVPHDYCAIYDPRPPTSLLCAIHHTILVMALSC